MLQVIYARNLENGDILLVEHPSTERSIVNKVEFDYKNNRVFVWSIGDSSIPQKRVYGLDTEVEVEKKPTKYEGFDRIGTITIGINCLVCEPTNKKTMEAEITASRRELLSEVIGLYACVEDIEEDLNKILVDNMLLGIYESLLNKIK